MKFCPYPKSPPSACNFFTFTSTGCCRILSITLSSQTRSSLAHNLAFYQLFYINKFLLGQHLSLRYIFIHNRGLATPVATCWQSQSLCTSLKDCKISSKSLTVFRASSYSHEESHSSRHATPYLKDEDYHHGLSSADVPDLGSSVIAACLTTHSTSHANTVTTKGH